MRKIYIFLLVLMPTLMYSQNNDSASRYSQQEIKKIEMFKDLLAPGKDFFSIGIMPFNYYSFKDIISEDEDLAGYLGFNLGYLYAHNNQWFMTFGFSFATMSPNTMYFGNSYDNMDISYLFDNDDYIGAPSKIEKSFTDINLYLTENIAFKKVILSFGLSYTATRNKIIYSFWDGGINHQISSRETQRSVYNSISTVFGLQYCFLKYFGAEMQMRYAIKEISNTGLPKDNLISINLGLNYKIPLQRPELKYKNGQYYEKN